MDRRIVVRGGTRVGGSRLDLYTSRGVRLAVDMGLELGRHGAPRLPDLEDFAGEDHLVITHAHIDHSGGLGFVDERTRIYGTEPTRELSELMLRDSSGVNRRKGYDDFYFTQDEIERILRGQYESLPFDKPTEISDGLLLSLWPAGHILGAAMPFIDDDGFTILHTANFSYSDQRLIAGARFFRPSVDLLVLDSTYGARDHEPVEDARRDLLDVIMETLRRNGKLLVTTFAAGRFQEVLDVISALKKAGLIPSSVKIYADGALAQSVTDTYYKHLRSLRWESMTDNPFAVEIAESPKVRTMPRGQRLAKMFPHVTFIDTDAQRKQVLESTEPSITVVGSGMAASPQAVSYVAAYAEVPGNTICMTGWVAEDSNAHQILASTPEGALSLRGADGNEVRLTRRCEVRRISFSAHAGQSELVEVVTQRVRPKVVLLVHGDDQAKVVLREKLLRAGVKRVLIPEQGEDLLLNNQLMAA